MDIKITIQRVEKLSDGTNNVVLRIDDAASASFIMEDNDLVSLPALQNKLKQKLKSKAFEGQTFTITI